MAVKGWDRIGRLVWGAWGCVLAVAVVAPLTGCSSTPPGEYTYSRWYNQRWLYGEPPPPAEPNLAQFERGRPNAVIDAMGRYFFSAPGKLLLLDSRVGNHRVSEENEEALREYLRANDLGNVKVRLNEYAPGGEFVRLWKRSDVNPFWRATAGGIYWLKYTLLPERLLAGFFICGDHYNPYTNTIHVYSDNQALMLESAARAKNVAERKYKGAYATAGLLPVVDLVQAHAATRDVNRYYYAQRNKEGEVAAYNTLIPLYPTRFADPMGVPLTLAIGPVPPLIQIGVSYVSAWVGKGVADGQGEARRTHIDPPPASRFAATK